MNIPVYSLISRVPIQAEKGRGTVYRVYIPVPRYTVPSSYAHTKALRSSSPSASTEQTSRGTFLFSFFLFYDHNVSRVCSHLLVKTIVEMKNSDD
jgi:hypothetical protein